MTSYRDPNKRETFSETRLKTLRGLLVILTSGTRFIRECMLAQFVYKKKIIPELG